MSCISSISLRFHGFHMLAASPLARSSRPLQSSSELTASLLRSSDWRQQLGALESPGAEHVALVAACCVGRAELRPAAARALRCLPGGARALAEALAGQEDRQAEELLLELAGGAREAYGLLPCGRFEDMAPRSNASNASCGALRCGGSMSRSLRLRGWKRSGLRPRSGCESSRASSKGRSCSGWSSSPPNRPREALYAIASYSNIAI